ncbi:hypothetical protein OJM14_gp82 [uncultured phage cr29_1]|uniref:hypothetical protein n=1 Tax=uncultured phage cr29_1 TaxID=2986418 RepID=UPI001C7451FA|nr:hypothetical protein OJM14_gp82 [uncultured phage cr29_1]
MILEKDFLYRVPVKNALVTTPGKLVRNPEILVDLEGGEFMHGDILDANSTNKLIDQSVKDAIDNSIENGNYVTKDLLEAETSARTKSDEDLNAKIKAEQTRAEGKEKEISDKLAIVDGDSNTEGSFRKAIADVIAAAPEDLDTLKEIADKLAGNDDLHTALNQAITEKADASALANEVTRATGVENDLRTAIGTKADATALSNYVLTTALNLQIDTLNAAISAKLDAGNYIPYDSSTISQYSIGKNLYVTNNNEGVSILSSNITGGNLDGAFYLDYSLLYFVDFLNILEGQAIRTTYSINGITSDKYNNCLATSDGTFKPISDFALKTELPTVPTNVSQLTNDSNFITLQDADAKYALANSLNTVNDSISSLRVGLSKKLNKITVNSVDVTDIETADITKLRTIVRSLIDALNTSGLIRTSSNIE